MLLTHIDPQQYPQQLAAKAAQVRALFATFNAPPLSVHSSPDTAYRMRAEFRVWHEGDDLFYVMFDPACPRQPLRVDQFPVAGPLIQQAMPALLQAVREQPKLRRKLFQVEFLSTLSGELLITLIYHRRLDEDWDSSAAQLAATLNARIVGRSRKQKRVLGADFVDECLAIAGREFTYRQFEQSFTQPNARVNIKMIEWACAMVAGTGGDLLELYCGNGNFTLPLSQHFHSVLATEVAKGAIQAARHNQAINGVDNLDLVRLSAEEVCQALSGQRPFRRLQDLSKPLAEFAFSTVFIDPPRAGLDQLTLQLVSEFDNIVYISCNPTTLAANLEHICSSHNLQQLALFDQFPYTHHVECGAYLQRRQTETTT